MPSKPMPTYNEAKRARELFAQGLSGHDLEPIAEDIAFLKMLLRKYPEWYRAAYARAKRRAAPFGSDQWYENMEGDDDAE